MVKTFFFFGDSITLGVNDTPAGGWVSRFAGLAAKTGLPVPPSTFYNLGARKHSTRHIQERWLSEFHNRMNAASKAYLVFCFGTVDMAAPNGSPVVPLPESIKNAEMILEEASHEAPFLLMGPPPVRNPEHQTRLVELNNGYAEMCHRFSFPYLDLQSCLPSEYVNDLSDGLHPGAAGNILIAENLLRSPEVQQWIRSE